MDRFVISIFLMIANLRKNTRQIKLVSKQKKMLLLFVDSGYQTKLLAFKRLGALAFLYI